MRKKLIRNTGNFAMFILLSISILIGGCESSSSEIHQAAVQQKGALATDVNVLERVLDEASRKGIEVVHHAAVVPSGSYAPGQMTMPAGTEYDGFTPEGIHTYYKNKEDTLTTAGSSEGIKYISGKGAVMYESKLYCFGF